MERTTRTPDSCKNRAFFLASKTQFDLIMFTRFLWMDAEHSQHQQTRLLLLLSTTLWFVHLLHFPETAGTSVQSFQICSLGWRSGLWGGSVHLFSVVADSFAAGSSSNSQKKVYLNEQQKKAKSSQKCSYLFTFAASKHGHASGNAFKMCSRGCKFQHQAPTYSP